MAGVVLAAGHGHALFIGFIAVLGLAAVAAWRLERHLPAGLNRVGEPVASAS